MNYEHELYHYGVKGMKWGVRKKRAVVDGLARRAVMGPGIPSSYGWGSKHQLSRAKKDLRILDDGGHLSIGITKKRQAAFDARDRSKLEKKISGLEAKEKSKSDHKVKAKAERALKKIENQKHKDFVKARSKEILKGESVVGKMWDLYTGGHKIQAEIEYNLRDYDD